MKMCPVGVELFHMDRQTDTETDKQPGRHDEAHNPFLQF